jgi:5-methylcytosine-specific restriction enzyme subunit McrC
MNCVKGRIIFSENLKHNIANNAKVFCEYDEFTMNNVLNQTFRFVAETLLQLTSVSETQKTLLRTIGFLSEVDDRRVTYEELAHVIIPEKSKDLQVVFSLAKMFLRYLHSDIYGGRAKSVAVLIDMNELFESFVFNLLNRNRDRLKIRAVIFQKGQRLVSGVRQVGANEFDGRQMFNTFQDVVVDFVSGNRLVIDTKYKLLDRDTEAHFGIANSDVYQILTYRELNAGRGESAVALLYPENTEKLQLEFRINSQNDIRFAVATLNLGIDMKHGVGALVNELDGLFQGLHSSIGTNVRSIE